MLSDRITSSHPDTETARKELFERRLREFYAKYSPDRLKEVMGFALGRFNETRETRQKCFELLHTKYGPEPVPDHLYPSWFDEVPASFREHNTLSDNEDSRRELFGKRLDAFYAVYDPQRNARSVTQAKTVFGKDLAGRKMCFEKLESKYGPEPHPHVLYPAWYDEVPRNFREFGDTGDDDGAATLHSAVSFVYSGVPNPAEHDDDLLSVEEIHDILLRTYTLSEGRVDEFIDRGEKLLRLPWARLRHMFTKKLGEEFAKARDPEHAEEQSQHHFSRTRKSAGVAGDVVVDYEATLKELLQKHDPMKVKRIGLLLATMADSKDSDETFDDAMKRGVEKIAHKNGVEAVAIKWKHTTADIASNETLFETICTFAAKHEATHKVSRSQLKHDIKSAGSDLEAATSLLVSKYSVNVAYEAKVRSHLVDFLNDHSRDVKTGTRKTATYAKNEALVKLMAWKDITGASAAAKKVAEAKKGTVHEALCDDVYELQRQDTVQNPGADMASPSHVNIPTYDRLVRFYEKYAPEKAEESNIQRILQAYDGKDEQLFKSLVGKYGPEPDDDDSVLFPTRRADFSEFLAPFFEPSDEILDELVEIAHSNSNAHLMPTLRAMFDVDDGVLQQLPKETREQAEKLMRFYQRMHIRKSRGEIYVIVNHYKLAGFPAMWKVLEKKYNTKIDDEDGGVNPQHQAKEDERLAQSQRLHKYFGRVASHKALNDATSIASSFDSHYPLMWELVERRFGVKPKPSEAEQQHEVENLREALRKSEAKAESLAAEVASLRGKVEEQQFELEMHVGVATTATTVTSASTEQHHDPNVFFNDL